MGKDDSIRTICKTIGSLSSRPEQHGPQIRQAVTVLCPLIPRAGRDRPSPLGRLGGRLFSLSGENGPPIDSFEFPMRNSLTSLSRCIEFAESSGHREWCGGSGCAESICFVEMGDSPPHGDRVCRERPPLRGGTARRFTHLGVACRPHKLPV